MYNMHFLGMHLFWWIMIAFVLFVFIFFDVEPKKRKANPIRILKKRLAAGEITIDEYNKLLHVLQRKNTRKEVRDAAL